MKTSHAARTVGATCPAARAFFGSLFGVLIAVSPSAHADVRFAGIERDLGHVWRTTSVAKPLDADGDFVYGTSGYVAFATDDAVNTTDGNTESADIFAFVRGNIRTFTNLPGYLQILTDGLDGVAYSYGYPLIDDPTAPPGAEMPKREAGQPIHRFGTVPGVEYSALQIRIGSNFPPSGVRVGFGFDVDHPLFTPTAIRLVRLSTGQSVSAAITPRNMIPDLYHFDLVDMTPGEVVAVFVTNNAENPAGHAFPGPSFIAVDSLVCPGISQPPVSLSICTSGTALFTVTANGSGPLSHQWRRNQVPIDPIANPSAATATLTLSNVSVADAAAYDCIVSNNCGSVTSSSATLTVCAADVNCSSSLSVQDIFDFLAAYFAGNLQADFNASGAISVQDIFDFLAAYFAGCV